MSDVALEECAEKTEYAPAPWGQGGRLDLDRHGVEQGLAKLVLTLVELLRQLLERQAVSRMERGTLKDEEIDRIGEALWQLEAKLDEICEIFGLRREELNIDLGPLGDLL